MSILEDKEWPHRLFKKNIECSEAAASLQAILFFGPGTNAENDPSSGNWWYTVAVVM